MLPFRLSGLLSLLWLEGLVVGATSLGEAGCNLFFCLNVTITNHEIMTYQVTPLFEPFGWVGLGFGRLMKDTHMVVMWENEDGSKVVSQRYGTGHVEPVVAAPLAAPSPPRLATLVPATVTSTASHAHTNYSTIAFRIPLNQTDPQPGQMIWAYGLNRPDPDPSSTLTFHHVAGTINMRLDKDVPDLPGLPSRPTLSRHQKLIWHGILLSVGFLVLLPTGSLVARWGRTFTPRWFNAHRTVNFGLALPVISVGFTLGPLAVLDRQAQHFADAHQICGVLLFGLYLVQLFVGRYIHSRRTVVGRPPHPPSNILHVALGIAIITLAFLQVRSGLGEWTRTQRLDMPGRFYDGLTAWSAILPVLYITGLALLKRQFVQERNGHTYDESPEAKNYIALAAAPSPILFDSEHEDTHLAAYSELESGVPLLHNAAV